MRVLATRSAQAGTSGREFILLASARTEREAAKEGRTGSGADSRHRPPLQPEQFHPPALVLQLQVSPTGCTALKVGLTDGCLQTTLGSKEIQRAALNGVGLHHFHVSTPLAEIV